MNRIKLVSIISCLALIAAAAYFAGRYTKPEAISVKHTASVRKPSYWVSPMNPNYRSDRPGKPYDFNGDGDGDGDVGSPYGTVGTVQKAGFVTIVNGSSSGLNAANYQVFGQNSPNIPSTAEADDHFAYSLASADLDHDGYADLVIGVPDEDRAGSARWAASVSSTPGWRPTTPWATG